MYKSTALLISVLLFGFSFALAQDYSKITKPNVVVTGDENPDLSNAEVYETSGTISFDQVVSSGGLLWDVHNITETKTGYDLQSNASTEQVWLDINNPDFLHAVFTNSQQDATWSDRTSLYFGSADGGVTWNELGGVPVNNGTDGRSGFPAIHGLSTGAAVIANHNNSNGSATHTKLFVDSGPFQYNFTEYDAGAASGGGTNEPIWPRLAVNQDDDVVFVSSQNEAAGAPQFVYTNFLDLPAGTFNGYVQFESDEAEQYALAVSDGGKIGLAYNGAGTGDDDQDVFYNESTDGGMTWGTPVKVYDSPLLQDTALGAIRGVTVNFYGEEPCVSFEICQQVRSSGSFFPGLPSELHFWSPNINGGVSKSIADTTNVPYFPYTGTNDVMVPICRPVLSRSQMHNVLLLAFTATTENYQSSSDSTSYMAGYFMYSMDGGDTWTDPEMFTPVGLPGMPVVDWRYPSIVPVCPVSPEDNDKITVHIVMQGDTIAGSTVNAAGQPIGVTAQYYHFSTDIILVGNDDEILVNSFNLEQNYPNPFNPSTTINYSLAERTPVTLKVYDVLGKEVANLVNTTQEAGDHSINFNASQLASGLYIYTLSAGDFTSSKKMMLLK
jgi:hypothetical protein